jgi:transcriptional regulator of arginine metabolism
MHKYAIKINNYHNHPKKPNMTICAQLKRLLSQGISGNQAQLVQALEKRGIHTTQSSVSRALKKINAIKAQDERGNAVYALVPSEPGLKDLGFFDSLVNKISDNGYQIVIQTRPGTANTVAKFIDDHGFDQVLGSVAGDDTIIIVPRNVAAIRQTVGKITTYMKQIGIFVA